MDNEINWYYLGQLPDRAPVRFSYLKLAALGYTNKEIAVAHGVSVGTVKKEFYIMYRITGASNRAHLSALAYQAGIL